MKRTATVSLAIALLALASTGSVQAAKGGGGRKKPPPPVVADLQLVSVTANHSPYVEALHSADGLVYSFTVRNNGGDSVTGVTIRGIISGGPHRPVVPSPQGSCTAVQKVSPDLRWDFTCDLGSLGDEETKTVSIALDEQCAAGKVTVYPVTVSSNATTDPDANNNVLANPVETAFVGTDCGF
jgi:hypothetical protein